ncbi:MAG TPA: hypothetical protein VF576_02045, partial [Rubricoccaceae bacterium]
MLRTPQAFRVFAVAFPAAVGLGTAAVFLVGAWDFWEHLAAVRALAEGPWRPGHPILDTARPSHLYTPYHLGWALVMRALGADILAVAVAAAAVNAALFVGAVSVLDRLLGGTGRDRLLLALTLLFAWVLPWRHSGVYGAGLLPASAVFASAFAQPLAVFVFAAARRAPTAGPRAAAAWAAVAVGAAGVFVVHPATGAFLAVALGLCGLAWVRDRDVRAVWLAGAAGTAGALCLEWPLFPVAGAALRSGEYAALGFGGAPGLWQEGAAYRLLP